MASKTLTAATCVESAVKAHRRHGIASIAGPKEARANPSAIQILRKFS
jgi:hypothetical protein